MLILSRFHKKTDLSETQPDNNRVLSPLINCDIINVKMKTFLIAK